MVAYAQEPLKKYLDDLAAKQETPGGGSVAGLVSALAAGLGSMVCNYTIGKKKYAEFEEDITQALQQCEQCRQQLLDLMQEDVDVFQNQMGGAYAMPKDTEEQTAARKKAIQDACKAACQPPLKIARLNRDMLKLFIVLAEKGNAMLVSDVGVAIALAQAAFTSATLNVKINLNYMGDKDLIESIKNELPGLISDVAELSTAGMIAVETKMS